MLATPSEIEQEVQASFDVKGTHTWIHNLLYSLL